MELTVMERLVLLNLLPREGNFKTLKLLRELRESLSFDELENKRLNFQQVGEQVMWDKEADNVRDIKVGDLMTELIVETLKELDKKKTLKEEQFTLYEKFVANL
jgi:hypothetical protein